MSRVATALFTACSLALVASAASAQTLTIEFNYDANASAQANYASFQHSAQKACAVDPRASGTLRAKAEREKACTARFLDQVVAQVADATLIAFHQETRSAAGETVYARVSQ